MVHSRFLALLLVAGLLGGCMHARTRTKNNPRIWHPAARAALFPLNVGPNILSNLYCGFFVLTELGPIAWLFAPFGAPFVGIYDAAMGYPFWSPSTLYSKDPIPSPNQ